MICRSFLGVFVLLCSENLKVEDALGMLSVMLANLGFEDDYVENNSSRIEILCPN